MRRIIYSIILPICLSISLSSIAQSTITGVVKTPEKLNAEGAIVTLLQSKDSVLVKAVITDSIGQFEIFTNKRGDFIITIVYQTAAKYYSPVIHINGAQAFVKLEVIQLLTKAGNTLDEVMVASKLPFVEKKFDRTVINPDALIVLADTTHLEMLFPSSIVLAEGLK
jgi:hypothetical protein